MAIYQNIIFQKAKRSSACNLKDEKANSTSEKIPSDGDTIKEFYESVITMETKSNTSSTSSQINNGINFLGKPKKTRKSVKGMTLNSFLKAAAEGDLKYVKEFVELQKFDINMKDNFGWTALMCACCNGQVDVVTHLLNHGAEWIDIKDKSGADAMSLAKRARHTEIMTLLRNNENGCIITGSVSDSREQTKPFYCCSCNTNIETSTRREHTSSTVHQFCMQHTKPPTVYYLNDSNKGYQMMLKGGWDSEQGLGPDGTGMKFPVKTTLKRDRRCLGSKLKDCRPRITHFKPFDTKAVKKPREVKKSQERTNCFKNTNKMRKLEIEYRQSWKIESL